MCFGNEYRLVGAWPQTNYVGQLCWKCHAKIKKERRVYLKKSILINRICATYIVPELAAAIIGELSRQRAISA
jgi:hypothetical protein